MAGLMQTASQNAAVPFVLFGGAHLAAVSIIAMVTTALIIALRRAATLRRVVCWSLATLLLGNVVYAEIYWIATGTWDIAYSVPLHLCDLAHFVVAAALYAAGGGLLVADSPERSRWKTVFELGYYWGLAGTVQALLTPDLGVGYPHPECVRFFAGHGTIVASVLVLVIGLRIRPGRWSPLRVWAMTNVLVPPIMLFNWLSGSNYMFLSGPPAYPSIYDYFGPWPLITLEVVALVVMTLCYAPLWIIDRLGKRSPPA